MPAPGFEVAVLLCTYNGERFLPAQLRSIQGQSCSSWSVFASDDGSRDSTLEILQEFRRLQGVDRVTVFSGPQNGFVANFMSIMGRPERKYPYYAFCDQDDIWDPDKLERALQYLRQVPAEVPALYCSRTRLVDEQGDCLGYSPLFTRPPCFTNALVQSIAGGNTMVFNEALRQLMLMIGMSVQVVSHDWWAYQVVTGCGGMIHYDHSPTVGYRQHSSNLVGNNIKFRARLQRLDMLFKGRFRRWSDQNIAAIEKIYSHLTSQNREVFDVFRDFRSRSLRYRIKGWRQTGVHRQTLLGDLGLAAGIIMNKI